MTQIYSAVCIGDSITNGVGLPVGYPQKLVYLLGPIWSVGNAGVVGWHTTAMLAFYQSASSGVDNQGYNFVCIWGGVNDALGGDATATTIANLEAMYNGCLGDVDCIPVLITISPCSTGPGWSAAAQTKIETINTAVRAYAALHSVPIFDAYVAMADGVDPTKLAAGYSADGLHHNQAGATFAAQQIAALILAEL